MCRTLKSKRGLHPLTWLIRDGHWTCRPSCWAHFSPFEGWSIKRLLELGEAPGLEGLARALHFRVYARLNTEHTYFDDNGTLVFEMNVWGFTMA